MNTRQLIGLRISAMRGFRHMTQEQLSGLVGVSNTTLSGWEHGYRSPSAEKLILLSKTLDCSTDYLLGVVDEQHAIYKDGRRA